MLGQQLFNGIVLGSTYALFALGFTLVFGVLRVINLTYGFYFSAGAFAALWLTRQLGFPIWAALPVAALAAGIIAIFIDAALLTRLRRAKASELTSLMITLGAVLLLYSLMTLFLGPEIRRLPEGTIGGEAFTLGDVRVSVAHVLVVGTTVVLVGALWGLMRGTRLGLAIRALAENDDAALLMGINAGGTVAMVSFLSGALAGAAGVLIGLNFNAIQPFMGETMMLRGFVVVIVGGLGDIRGAVIAGMLLGILEVMTAGYVSSTAKEALGFAIMVLTLWCRPIGLFGRATAKRA